MYKKKKAACLAEAQKKAADTAAALAAIEDDVAAGSAALKDDVGRDVAAALEAAGDNNVAGAATNNTPLWHRPYALGWRRVLSHRQEGKHNKKDVYYITPAPDCKKLDRMSKVEAYLKKTGGELTKQNFVFVLRLIGYPPHETEIRASDQELDKKVETLEKRQDSLEDQLETLIDKLEAKLGPL